LQGIVKGEGLDKAGALGLPIVVALGSQFDCFNRGIVAAVSFGFSVHYCLQAYDLWQQQKARRQIVEQALLGVGWMVVAALISYYVMFGLSFEERVFQGVTDAGERCREQCVTGVQNWLTFLQSGGSGTGVSG